jgi:hypothetical protein
MLFMIRQWMEGKFIDEAAEDIVPDALHPGAGVALDHGVLGNAPRGS